MKLSYILNRMDDAVNPIVVKELRQAVYGRYIAATLMVFLVIELAITGFVLVSVDIV